MRIQRQDAEYEEEEYDEEGLENESSEDTKAPITTIFGVPKKIFIVGSVVLIIIILLLIMFAVRKGSYSSGDSYVSDSSGISVYDLSGTVIGTTDGTYEGAMIFDSAGTPIGTVSPVGEMEALDSSGNVIFNYSPMSIDADLLDTSSSDSTEFVSDDTYTESTDTYTEESADTYTEESTDTYTESTDTYTESTDTYTESSDTYTESSDTSGDTMDDWVMNINKSVQADQIIDTMDLSDASKVLKSYGYTGDEIELAKTLGVSVEQLVMAAQSLRDNVAAKSLERMSDHASQEFQMMYNYSLYSLPNFKYKAIPKDAETWVWQDGSFTVNADYEKCPTYGYQLQLKVKVANGTYAYMYVTPQHWEELADSGNIVVNVSYSLYGPDKKNAHLYITDIVEVDTTTHSVNPSDSGTNLSDMIDMNKTTTDTEEEISDDVPSVEDDVVWN